MAITYNGYQFGDYSHVDISAVMVEDDAQRTVLRHRYRIRVSTTIVAEAGDLNVGYHFRRIRQLLTKQGQALIIDHAGFGPKLSINSGTGGVRDVDFGPKPKIVNWDPVGATNAVEVVWECETSIPTCDGNYGARYTGIESINYTISHRINESGYTTRTISGHISIAMSASGQALPDTADAYRDFIIIRKPINFTRETTWNLSADKRRAEFTLLDKEIESPNAYPAGIIKISARHRVLWTRLGHGTRSMANLPNSISASITLAPGQSRARAWEVFRGIVSSRVGYAIANGLTVFIEALEVEEEIYSNTWSFNMQWRVTSTMSDGPLGFFFSGTGLGSPTPDAMQWGSWDASVGHLQSHRGIAGMRVDATQDQIINLCTTEWLPEYQHETTISFPLPTYYFRFCNERPPPLRSWLQWDTMLYAYENVPTAVQITLGHDDLKKTSFNPEQPTATYGDTDVDDQIRRFVEDAPAGTEFTWTGYAERVGWMIPRPALLNVGNKVLTRKDGQKFAQKRIGIIFCQPVYAAAWNQTYVVTERPAEIDEPDITSIPFATLASLAIGP